MLQIRYLILILILFASVVGFVSAVPPAPSPTCYIQGTIQSVEYREAYNEPCLSNCYSAEPGTCCPTDVELEHPSRYYLNVTINEVRYVDGETDFITCEESYPIGESDVFKINVEKVPMNYNFNIGDSIKGNVNREAFYSLDLSTDSCVSSQCASEGLLHKILNWFKKLFGA
jgi:hypothetical protein